MIFEFIVFAKHFGGKQRFKQLLKAIDLQIRLTAIHMKS